jgi:hypothetical protein
MRKCFLIAFALMLVFASASFALEKTAMRVSDVERENWGAATTCTVAYYNFCTGWIWVWGGWSPNDVIGVCYDCCCTNVNGRTGVSTTWELVYTAAPPGYGFTGLIELWCVDANCGLCLPWAGQPFYFTSGWNGHVWGGIEICCPFAVTVTFGPGLAMPSRVASDHPAVGPTGPQACGWCYPNPRTCHSYYYGTATSPLIPGTSLTDGICCVEWIWDVALVCDVGVEESSWAAIKSLYR